jgi:hypothetical protein
MSADLSGNAIIEQLASDDLLDSTYEWLCRRRKILRKA